MDHSRLLQTSLSKYFNKPLFSDITIVGPDGRKLLCHQVVLSAGSKRFANMLEQGASSAADGGGGQHLPRVSLLCQQQQQPNMGALLLEAEATQHKGYAVQQDSLSCVQQPHETPAPRIVLSATP